MTEFLRLSIDGYEVLVDFDCASLFNGRLWKVESPKAIPYLRHNTRRNGKRIQTSFHRLIMGAQKGQVVDHINGNSLDNRRCNLRFVTTRQNNLNSKNKSNSKSKFKGVGWSGNRWQVSIRHGGKQLYLGRYKCEIEAAYAYDIASLKYHGEFGRRNFLPLVF